MLAARRRLVSGLPDARTRIGTVRDFSRAPRPDDPAIMLMSGGTTGTAEGRRRTASLSRGGRHAAERRGCIRRSTRRTDVALVPLPLFMCTRASACRAILSSAARRWRSCPNPRDIDDLLKTIETVRPTLFSAVPALFIALLNHPKVKSKSVDFSSIRACFSGAAPLMAATKAQFEELTGGRIVEGYSLTEAMMACVVNPLNGINKVGRSAFRCPTSRSPSSMPKRARPSCRTAKRARSFFAHRS